MDPISDVCYITGGAYYLFFIKVINVIDIIIIINSNQYQIELRQMGSFRFIDIMEMKHRRGWLAGGERGVTVAGKLSQIVLLFYMGYGVLVVYLCAKLTLSTNRERLAGASTGSSSVSQRSAPSEAFGD